MSVDQATLQKHLEVLADAMRQIGDDARTLHTGDGADIERARVGGALGATIGIACQTFGVDTVRSVLGDFVSGAVSEQFWAMQRQLAESEKKPAEASASSAPALPASTP